MRVTEIFRTLQGEGARAGQASVFVRFSGCSAKHACATAGIVCDTEFESGHAYTEAELLDAVTVVAGTGLARIPWIVWTGGEPADQLTGSLVDACHQAGFQQQIETSGVRPVVPGLDWVTVSPKVAEHILERHFPLRNDGCHVDELKYVRHVGQHIPVPSLVAKVLCVSPHADGDRLNGDNLAHCINLCLTHPQWRLSIQQHKIWDVR
jgi:7-carboxy-7-deazaguanine synthase